MAIGPTFEKGEVDEADLQHAYEKAQKCAISIMEQMARRVLHEHSDYSEFFSAYGNWGFIRHDQHIVTGVYCPSAELLEFIRQWDAKLGLTYARIRFTANGPIVREW